MISSKQHKKTRTGTPRFFFVLMDLTSFSMPIGYYTAYPIELSIIHSDQRAAANYLCLKVTFS